MLHCELYVDGIGWYPGGVNYRAPYRANNKEFMVQGAKTFQPSELNVENVLKHPIILD